MNTATHLWPRAEEIPKQTSTGGRCIILPQSAVPNYKEVRK